MGHNSVGRPRSQYSQATRVLELYIRLMRGETLLAGAIAEEYGLNRRTLLRDIGLLRDVLETGLVAVEDPTPGWRLPGTRRAWDVGKWQVVGLGLGAQMIRFLFGRSAATELQPLLSELRHSLSIGEARDAFELARRVHVIESGQKSYRSDPRAQRSLEAMIDGLLLQQRIALLYHSPQRKRQHAPPRSLDIQALCMTVHRGGVYFVVEVLSADWTRATKRILLALDHMSDVTVDRVSEPLGYPRDFSPKDYFSTAFGVWTGDETHYVRLHIDSVYAHAVRARAWHHSQRVEEQPDGSLRLTMELGVLHEVADWVLGMGEHARVESPPALVTLLRERLARALAHYS